MAIDKVRATDHLRAFDFRCLFIEELGWDNPGSKKAESVLADGKPFDLAPVAEKRGVRIFHCVAIPDRHIRQKIEREVTKLAYEHLIIFTDPGKSRQIWQWVAREKSKPAAFREYDWRTGTAPDLLLQKLDHIAFSLNDEEGLTLAGTTVALRDAFDREQITKRFYENFKKQHDAFLGFIKGLANAADAAWYASLMLNRLMFVYFIQKKGFLDGDIHYLRNRLNTVRKAQGKDQFHSFYRAFLLKLFHGGLATPVNSRDADTAKMIGNIPYLNGGLFEPHALESEDHEIQIADTAFEAVFGFFDQYEWTLDTRAITEANGREINPDVLGHIFEKYVNQKQMGAYYTKEDITDYITRSTVIPWLFRNAEGHDKVAFEPVGAVWRMLADDPDTYIFKSVRHGADVTLPENIAAGVADVAKRGDWNKVANSDIGLPTETWREAVGRRERYVAIKAKLAAGEVSSIEELITLNLDIRQFVQDAIQYAESPDLIRAFWKGISAVKVLDPACGSGAFLFAALNILYDLYDACLERMEQFVASAPEGSGPRQQYSDFRDVLARITRHPNRAYFIYKSIILDNLYGVDIMDEAVEICKLRLFLKLGAQLESADQIEPLPDIDFNIRAGNTLIGYTSFADVRKATEAKGFDFDDRAGKIEKAAQDLAEAFRLFRQQQTTLHGHIDCTHKAELRAQLDALDAQLDSFLAQDYGIQGDVDLADTAKFRAWKASHKPFHWLAEFYAIITAGGFDVVVGNPPYLETKEVEYLPKNFATLESRAIHALFIERSNDLLAPVGSMSMILPMSLVSTQRMKAGQTIIEKGRTCWYSNFAWRPAKLFDNVNRALTIFVACPSNKPDCYSTGYIKWTAPYRDNIIFNLSYVSVPHRRDEFYVPKLQSPSEMSLLAKVRSQPDTLEKIWRSGGGSVFYRTTGGLYWKVFTTFAPRFYVNGTAGSSGRETRMQIAAGYSTQAVAAILSSSTFWWWYTIESNLRDLNPTDIKSFKVNDTLLRDPELANLGQEYMIDLERNSFLLTREQKQTGTTETQSFKIRQSKPIIDKIDGIIAKHFGFSDEELDFILNYDIKFRLGADEDDAA
ncbi:Eco57I restriction-modification methylase domain-containing protein [Acidiphilium sp. PM]|uniref:Eco57I restriction-modification methylase domain-containing protein n=1 Tax=Acidiphilium sp. PM TaxID=1043206 RepID=UPI0002144F4C|nr:DNA methyltransferase [Acidiphilium sp. PM]EGO93349.1 site-specific DNA-methyltransferase (adenine-specific) [Acidiphilium sp. PM]